MSNLSGHSTEVQHSVQRRLCLMPCCCAGARYTYDKCLTTTTRDEGLSALHQSTREFIFFFYRISSSHIFNSVCWSHALVNGPTSKRPASDGGRCSGQLLMMWSAVCSGSPHSHAALSASPHFFMEALYRPTPVRSLFRVVQCFRLSSSPLTPSSGSDTWRCTRVGLDASHSCFHVAAIHASFYRSSGMTLSIS